MNGFSVSVCNITWYEWFQCERLDGGMMKLAEASTQLEELNAKLAVQKVAVTEKTEACEALLAEIAAGTTQAQEKKAMAQQKGKEIEEQSKIIAVEKVSETSCSLLVVSQQTQLVWL